jgi:hypothetical protein
MKKPISTQSGYTLLFAVLVSVLVLGVAVFITGTARKQFILSSTVRDSMYSFYAADSGIECAAAAYKAGTLDLTLSSISIPCGGSSHSASPVSPPTIAPDSSLGFASSPAPSQVSGLIIALPQNSCALLTITAGTTTSGVYQTVIESRGYNVGTSVICPQISSRTVERALRLVYYK